MKFLIHSFIILIFISLFLLFSKIGDAEELFNFEEFISKINQSYANINDYGCRFSQRQLIRDSIREDNNLIFKFKKPQCIYMQWTEGSYKDIEAIYVEGRYDNKLIVHLNGFFSFITVSLDPTGSLAMKNNRHSIKEAGIGFIIKMMNEEFNKSKKDKINVVRQTERIMLNGRKMIRITSVCPPDKGYYNHFIYIYIDEELYLPVKIVVYGWKNEFLEEYAFEDIKIGVGLTDKDFDTNNPDYEF